MQNDWWTALAEKTQGYADVGDILTFYEALNAVCVPSHQILAPLVSSDGSTLLTDKKPILQRWSEHFEDLFSEQLTVQDSSPAKVPQVDIKLQLDDPPTREEIKKATIQLKMSKPPGIDGIPAAEVFICTGETRCLKASGSGHQLLEEKDSTAGPSPRTPEGKPWMSDVSLPPPPVWNLRAVIWFHFTISCLVLLPSPVIFPVFFFLLPAGPFLWTFLRKFFNTFR